MAQHISVINFFGIVLLALVDVGYKFTYVDTGCQGSISDGGAFKNCDLCKLIANGEAKFPKDRQLPDMPTLNGSFLAQSDRTLVVLYVIIAVDAFPLSTFCMKPDAQSNLSDIKTIFRYQVSRGRRTTENTFGILSIRFRVLSSCIYLQPSNATKITLTHCVLHNILGTVLKNSYSTHGFVDEIEENSSIRSGEWRNGLHSVMRHLAATISQHASRDAEKVCKTLSENVFMVEAKFLGSGNM